MQSVNRSNQNKMRLVSSIWLAACILGSLPYLITGYVDSPVSAFFLSVSSFTTTGASLGSGLDGGLLLYYTTCQWLGGLAILVFLSSLLPSVDSDSKSGLDSSFAGRSFSEVIKSREGNMLFLIYVSISLVMFIVMVCLGHVPLEALELTLTVCSTGGLGGTAFSAIDAGIKGTGAICIASMILSTISFTVYARLIKRDFAYVKKNTELRAYACLLVSSTLLICAANRISGVIPDIWQSFRAAGFHAVSFSSTTGLTNGDINGWPAFSKAVLCMLSFFGASSVSTGSGIKLIRIIIALKAIRRSFYRRIHPRVVMSLRINGKAISDDTVDQVMSFIIHYALLFLAGCFVFSFSAPDLETAFFSSSSLINNLGSGFGAVGAECGYDFLGPFGKLFGCFLMLAGRLEIYALMLPFSRDGRK